MEGICYLQKHPLLYVEVELCGCSCLEAPAARPAQHSQLVPEVCFSRVTLAARNRDTTVPPSARPALNRETCVRGVRRALGLGSLGFFASLLLLCWVYVKLFSQISINNREYRFYKYADFRGPGVFVTVPACLFKLPEIIAFFSFFPFLQGIIRVPAPCQYAHKLAFFVGQSIHREPNMMLSDRLYYL